MLYWSFISFAVALTAGLFGFGGDATVAAGLAQVLFFVFLGVSLVLVAIKAARENSDDTQRQSE
ncbi:hypothetical protein PARPLA_00223 [Rhodobacteraceae bacterium THAF1]|nr:hypothetical protein FIU81_16145 [Palleronia sp. THAF1]VDC16883.1 hypothetical protein PARPLA_00223 [Rhodobacteraceae bacterium THAF1]